MKITALDLGASTGVAFGHSGQSPEFATWNLRASTLAQRCRNLFEHFTSHLLCFMPERIYIEAPMNLAAMGRVNTRSDTIASLYGYSAIVQMASALDGIEPQLIGVQTVRKHFLGFMPKGGEGKKCVMERCRVLGWTPANENEGDAGALWDYACAIEDSAAHLRERLRQSVRLNVVGS